MQNFSEKVSFIGSVADLLRGVYRQSEYGRVILPFLVMRRLDQVLAPNREAVIEVDAKFPAVSSPEGLREQMLLKASGETFYNTSQFDFRALLDDPNNAAANLIRYINGFSKNVLDIMETFRFEEQISRLEEANLLFLVIRKFLEVDLDPYERKPDGKPFINEDGKPLIKVTNTEMGYIFEDLIRKFSEQSNETAGEHFTPREVIKLMVNLLFAEDHEVLYKPGIVRTMYDPACGTGGMLSVAEEHLSMLNPQARLLVFGQEINGESYAICKADMLIKGQDANRIKYGNSFSNDGLSDLKADYLISNPPFGVDWSKARSVVKAEHEERGYAGRFGPGLPRKNDGSLLFLQHMISKMKPLDQGGSRLAIVFNASPLFTGAAGSGESEIRKWIIENDWLEAIIALPDNLFYNTGINTYIWVITNRKALERKGKIQLIDGTSFYQKMRKSLGDKRHELSDDHIAAITRLYGTFEEGKHCKIFDNEDFGYYRIKVERPLRQNYQASTARIEKLWDETGFVNLAKSRKKDPEKRQQEEAEGAARQQEILNLLETMSSELFTNQKPFWKAIEATRKEMGIDKLKSPEKKAVLSALAETDEEADVVQDSKGRPQPDSDLRDYENIPLKEEIAEYFEREVLPYVPDAWIDEDYTRVGYEIPFTRHFYEYEPPRPLEEIEAEILALEEEIQGMLREVVS